MRDPRTKVLDVGFERALRPLLFRVGHGDPERAHELAVAAVGRMAHYRAARMLVGAVHPGARRSINVAGIEFPGPVGLAAGMDKQATATLAWGSLGFSHVELGTITARPQPGNDKPRLFRLAESQAIINRMGFNNDGAEAVAERLRRDGIRRGNRAAGIPIGISLGKSKVTPLEEAIGDYLRSFSLLSPYADYVAVNVSSPNTPGLRKLQDAEALTELVQALVGAAATSGEGNLGPVPIFVKVAPDLSRPGLDELLSVCVDNGVSGLIATNTTLARMGLRGADRKRAGEAGGLSGAPLTTRALDTVRYLAAQSTLPVIGVGGIMTAADAEAMFEAGAALVQVYTGYIFHGPALVAEINRLKVAR